MRHFVPRRQKVFSFTVRAFGTVNMVELPEKFEYFLSVVNKHLTALVKGHKCEVIHKLASANKPKKIRTLKRYDTWMVYRGYNVLNNAQPVNGISAD